MPDDWPDHVIPEPGTLNLLALSGLIMLKRRRRTWVRPSYMMKSSASGRTRSITMASLQHKQTNKYVEQISRDGYFVVEGVIGADDLDRVREDLIIVTHTNKR